MHQSTTTSRLLHPLPATPALFAPYGSLIQSPAAHPDVPNHLLSVPANHGTATKWLDATHLDNHYARAVSRQPGKPVVNLFACRPRPLVEREGKLVFPVKLLERHPHTPQMFVPLGVSARDADVRYLVIVAPTLPERKVAASALATAARGVRERVLGAMPFFSNLDSSDVAVPSAREPKGPGEPDLANLQAFVVQGDQAVTYGAGTWHAPMVVLGEKVIDFVVVQFASGVPAEDCQEVEVAVFGAGEGVGVVVGEIRREASGTGGGEVAADGIMRAPDAGKENHSGEANEMVEASGIMRAPDAGDDSAGKDNDSGASREEVEATGIMRAPDAGSQPSPKDGNSEEEVEAPGIMRDPDAGKDTTSTEETIQSADDKASAPGIMRSKL